MSIIILEGPDGSGKSTLADWLKTRGYSYLHNGLYEKESGEQLLQLYSKQLLQAHQLRQNLVIDRSYLSEGIYGDVMRHEDRLGDHGRRLMQRLTRALGVAEVICLPQWPVVRKNWEDKRRLPFSVTNRTGDYVDKERKHKAIWARYAAVYWKAKTRFVRYDYRHDDVPRFNWFSTRYYPGLIGNYMGGCLIVGEQIANRGRWDTDLPFYSLKGVSQYLDGALQLAKVPEHDLAFINAYDDIGNLNVPSDVITNLPNLCQVICLGKEAEKVWAGILKSRTVPHPSYWKRFKHADKNGYASMLRRAYRAV